MTDIQNMQNWKKYLEITGSGGERVWVKSEKKFQEKPEKRLRKSGEVCILKE